MSAPISTPGLTDAQRAELEAYGVAKTMGEQINAIRAENERLRAELRAAVGYMLNAKIDLDTGRTKATGIATISMGLERARAALEPKEWMT